MKEQVAVHEFENQEKIEFGADLTRALAHNLRLRILAHIDSRGGETYVKDIYKPLDIEQSNCSLQLKLLLEA